MLGKWKNDELNFIFIVTYIKDIFFSFLIREQERSRKQSQAADVLAPSAPAFYTGGGKRGYQHNVDTRTMMADAFLNRNRGIPISQFSQFAATTNHPTYAEIEQYGRRRRSSSRSHLRCRHCYYSNSSDSYSSPERNKKRRRESNCSNSLVSREKGDNIENVD